MKHILTTICFFCIIYLNSNRLNAQSWSGTGGHLTATDAGGNSVPGPNIGIGTATPATKVDIVTNTSGTKTPIDDRYVIRMKNEDQSSLSCVGLRLSSNDNDNNFGALVYHNSTYSIVPGLANTLQLFSFGNGIAISSMTKEGSIRFNTNVDQSNYQVERMRIDGNGNVGIGTKAPTARLHVKATSPNIQPSPVRFENLPQGIGVSLIINKDGYIQRAKYAPAAQEDVTALKSELESLEQTVKSLETELRVIKGMIAAMSTGKPASNTSNGYLEQTIPNPATANMQIPYLLPHVFGTAEIIVYAPSGMIQQRTRIYETGAGKLEMDISGWMPGVYVYSLFVDGAEISSRKMVLK